MSKTEMTERQGWTVLIVFGLLAVILVGGGLVGCPHYKVWERKMAGQAELQYQQGARQALIAQAAAEDEAAIKRAEAPILANAAPTSIKSILKKTNVRLSIKLTSRFAAEKQCPDRLPALARLVEEINATAE